MSSKADTLSKANGLLAMLDLKGHHLLACHLVLCELAQNATTRLRSLL